ncbi:unnamed protein product [Porites evermanni]|uniref:G-protein coupled receptors family 1 profile domain-containing protein n=1 Tax=Porites evermanni TaxID=104178 RepID=A0ABN8RUX3_9CNID|nr:unnamed protein product [Porites evermanni]
MVFLKVIAVIHALFDVVGLPGNLLVILTISFERRLHVMRYILLASLAVSDFLNLILDNSFRIASMAQEKWLYGQTMCYLNPCIHRYFYINTILHLVAVSYDRYKAIVKSPLTYDGTITMRNALFMSLIWLIPIPVSMGPIFGYGLQNVYNPEVFRCENGWLSQRDKSDTRNGFIYLSSFIVPFLVIFFLNWSVYNTAKMQINALAQEAQLGGFDDSAENLENNQQELIRKRKERKASVDVVVIIAAFLFCFFPLWVVNLLRKYATSIHLPPYLILGAKCIYVVSSVCNTIIYSIRKREFRAAVKQIFSRLGLIGSSQNDNDVLAIDINNLRNRDTNSKSPPACTSPRSATCSLGLVIKSQDKSRGEDNRETEVNFQRALNTIPEIDGY